MSSFIPSWKNFIILWNIFFPLCVCFRVSVLMIPSQRMRDISHLLILFSILLIQNGIYKHHQDRYFTYTYKSYFWYKSIICQSLLPKSKVQNSKNISSFIYSLYIKTFYSFWVWYEQENYLNISVMCSAYCAVNSSVNWAKGHIRLVNERWLYLWWFLA